MNRIENLEQVETRAYRSTLDDGLIDLFVGSAILVFGICMTMGNFILMVPVYGLPILWPLIRKRWITPRMGYVRYSAGRTKALRWGIYEAMAIGATTLLVVITITYGIPWLRRYSAAEHSIGVIWTLFLLTVVVAARIPRFALYSGIMFFGTVVGIASGLAPEAYVLGTGILVIAAGVAMLWRFARRNPIGQSEEYHATN